MIITRKTALRKDLKVLPAGLGKGRALPVMAPCRGRLLTGKAQGREAGEEAVPRPSGAVGRVPGATAAVPDRGPPAGHEKRGPLTRAP